MGCFLRTNGSFKENGIVLQFIFERNGHFLEAKNQRNGHFQALFLRTNGQKQDEMPESGGRNGQIWEIDAKLTAF